MSWLYLLGWVALFTAIYFLTRKSWRKEGIFLLLPTKKGTNFIKQFGQKHSKFFKWFGNVSIVVGIVCSVIMVYLLILNLQIYFSHPEIAGPAVKILLPIEVDSPYVLSISWHIFLICIVLLLIFHELAHAFVATAQKIKVRELGLAFIGIGPVPIGPIGAFTAPDEKQVAKTTILNRMRIFAAGPGANILIIGVLTFVFITLFAAISSISPQGVLISNVTYCENIEQLESEQPHNTICNPSLDGLNVSQNVVIYKLRCNEQEYQISDYASLYNSTSKFKPGQNATLLTSAGEYNFSFIKNPTTNKTSIGIMFSLFSDKNTLVMNVVNFFNLHLNLPLLKYGYYAPTFENNVFFLLCWLFVINLFVGLFNLLPLKPLDGGYICEDLLNLLVKNTKAIHYLKFSIYFLVFALLLANIFNQQFFAFVLFIQSVFPF
ncbi:MAG: hypothetical protein COY63_02385 [Candidatus Huberarchaeum crystalense]|uniref:Peptidase M50 domain-containing protein n=1 Tax=Huberarchaeum crystalense TaxID=2014257 RepID=A0A2G9LJU5_HUBC1|nr:MAG: hypothetical protein COW69_00330 [Candidatus Huberarchaeum crystalense]PIY99673.1 MAG: hypothetical protein COY63_02385 [Candidatus Huberarchaeum crystalense]PJC01418.1 MAG: hypothetical protein CO072_01365 [Candidatus Huberarchaeum crystalense]